MICLSTAFKLKDMTILTNLKIKMHGNTYYIKKLKYMATITTLKS